MTLFVYLHSNCAFRDHPQYLKQKPYLVYLNIFTYLNRIVGFTFHRNDSILVLRNVHIVGGRVKHILPPMIVHVVRLIVSQSGFIEFIRSLEGFTYSVVVLAQTIA